MLEMPDGNIVLPRPPQNARKVAKGRRNHFTGQTNVGADEENGMDIESYTELQVLLALLARPGIVHVENQVEFSFTGPDGRLNSHFFDFRATKIDGSRTAIMVKAAYRFAHAKIRDELVYVASRVPNSFADKATLEILLSVLSPLQVGRHVVRPPAQRLRQDGQSPATRWQRYDFS